MKEHILNSGKSYYLTRGFIMGGCCMNCAMCGKSLDDKRGLVNHLRHHNNVSVKVYYDTYIKKEGEGVCPVCGKATAFIGLRGYRNYCSINCVNADPMTKEKKKKTKLASPKLRKGAVSLAVSNPELVQEWDIEKNKPLTPDVVASGSTRVVWWICPKGHSYDGTIHSRAKRGCGCPYCSGHRVIVGENDLQTTNPQLAEEWHPYKNGELKPTDVMEGSNKKVWWLGKCGHEWYAYIYPRSKGVGCPKCKSELHTSFSEQAVFYYIQNFFPDAINGDKNAIGMELDVYLPSVKVAIEYDGEYYHRYGKKIDVEKNITCKKNGIVLIRVQETEDHQYEDCICLVRGKKRSKEELNRIIKEILEILDVKDADIDVTRDEQDILSLYLGKKEKNSLLALYPEVAEEWHFSKNGLLTPDKVISGSMKNVWWKGKCGHEWKARIAHRAQGIGCPFCSGNKAIKNINDLQTLYPELAKEWDYERNKGLKNKFGEDISTPDKVAAGSNSKVWWIGKCGHSWEERIAKRKRGDGCPYCSNHQVLAGFNDLASCNPDIASEWHPVKNKGLTNQLERDISTPDKITVGSNSKVWWLGKCGHEWRMRVVSRTAGGAGCPICKGTMGTRVICIETGIVYQSLTEAFNATGAQKASIVNCCKGRQQRAGGYHWKYYNKS